MEIHSPVCENGEELDPKFTCDGDDVSPPLRWEDPPDETSAFALIVDDPDAPGRTWVHWLLYDLDADARDLDEGVPDDGSPSGGAKQGRNDFGNLGYGGPCPPAGPPHRYFFKLYALDEELGLDAGATKPTLLEAMEGHVLAEAQLMVRYRRR